MISLNKYLLESLKNQDYINVKFTDADVKKLSIKDLIRGTKVNGYKLGNFPNYGYCEFEKTNKDEWTFVRYTDDMAVDDSSWKDAKSKEKYTNSELEVFIKNRKNKNSMLYASVPTKTFDGDFVEPFIFTPVTVPVFFVKPQSATISSVTLSLFIFSICSLTYVFVA